ncbi:hypothetical protein LJR220_003368 [Bradyrhizobium sp. LjRoot220]|uniref:hypothetical protein n=1 Tax=Bradyrhizobium sp. LjRoot220 TaxID=3342284 RepID=UPI003ECCA52A
MTTAAERIASTPLAIEQRRWNIRVVVAADKYTVATVSQGINDREEYARLFSAAPDMLAALHRITNAVEISAADIAVALAAISKAEGKT